jgi:hypothetical protein
LGNAGSFFLFHFKLKVINGGAWYKLSFSGFFKINYRDPEEGSIKIRNASI